MKELIGKWADYSKAVDYIILHATEHIQMDVEVIEGKKFYVLSSDRKEV